MEREGGKDGWMDGQRERERERERERGGEGERGGRGERKRNVKQEYGSNMPIAFALNPAYKSSPKTKRKHALQSEIKIPSIQQSAKTKMALLHHS